ncbi:MAG: tRNA (adenosine(37)-N6)-threonylcarbamoyltransferase complex dimerization subunit type 1 TsaB [Parabacteroides sp.]
MSCILNIETSTSACSVAVSAESRILFERTTLKGPSHASVLGVFVEEALQEAKQQGQKLSAVAVSCGPGSYTGLRIGVSMAKGLCFGYGIPLIAIHTLDIVAASAIRQTASEKDWLYCPMLDARRMEVYAALYDAELQQVRSTAADIVTEETYAPYLAQQPVCFCGDGAAKCQSVISSPNAHFLTEIVPLATEMVPLAEKAYTAGRFEDVAYFEPFYLKEFQATIAKNKVLSRELP